MNNIQSNINFDNFNKPSFSCKNRLMRIIWWIVYITLFRWTPPPLFIWRNLLLKLFGAKLGKNCHVYPKVKIWAPWNLIMGDHSCLANHVICYSMEKVYVGSRSIISQGAHLCTGSHDYNDPNFQLTTKIIQIDSDVWVCAEAFVGPGVIIGEGAVLGARGVTTKNLAPWEVYAGNPAVFIKKREIRDK